MTKIIYIASHSHSGSTLLEMLLSGHPRICGLGETHMLLDPAARGRFLAEPEKHICSCGSPIDRCELWSAFIRFLQEEAPDSFGSSYRKLLDLTRDQYGEDVILTDSSKYLTGLSKLAGAIERGELAELSLFVVHLVKDVRGFASSLKDRHRESGMRAAARAFRRFGVWYRGNLEIAEFLSQHRLPHQRIGYEELCFDPEASLRLVCHEAGIQFTAQMLDLERSSGHIGLGNPMRSHATKSRRLSYDNRWFFEPVMNLLYLARPKIRRYNERSVYGNLPQE